LQRQGIAKKLAGHKRQRESRVPLHRFFDQCLPESVVFSCFPLPIGVKRSGKQQQSIGI
jgi:hypothetical protein